SFERKGRLSPIYPVKRRCWRLGWGLARKPDADRRQPASLWRVRPIRPPDVAGQPIPLTIIGPRRVAAASGSRFQSEASALNLGLRGFKSGIGQPAAKRY